MDRIERDPPGAEERLGPEQNALFTSCARVSPPPRQDQLVILLGVVWGPLGAMVRLGGLDIACAVVVAHAKKVTVVYWGDLAGEHPLEALYQARDWAWQAVCAARHREMSEADRASCEIVARDLISALEALGTTCALTSSAPRTRASDEPGREVWLSRVLDSLGRDHQGH